MEIYYLLDVLSWLGLINHMSYIHPLYIDPSLWYIKSRKNAWELNGGENTGALAGALQHFFVFPVLCAHFYPKHLPSLCCVCCVYACPLNDNILSAPPLNRWTAASLTLIHPTSIKKELIGMLKRWLPANVVHTKALCLINDTRQGKICQQQSPMSLIVSTSAS